MRDLFVKDGLSFLCQPIGSSDFVDGPDYTFDDMPAGASDYMVAVGHRLVSHVAAREIGLPPAPSQRKRSKLALSAP